MTPKWYIIQAYQGSEQAVKNTIDKLILDHNLQDKIKNVIIPTETVSIIRNGVEKKTKRIMYPGYVFVHLILDADIYHHLEHISKSKGFMCNNKVPSVVSDAEIEKILNRMENAKPKPKFDFEVNEFVKIIDSIYANFHGTITEYNGETNVVKINVLAMGKIIPVELTAFQIEKIS